MVYIVFIVIGIVSLAIGAFLRNKIALLGSLIFLIASIIVPVIAYTGNMGTIAELQAFYEASSTNFQISRDDTASYLSEDKIVSNTSLIPITGSIEKIGLGVSVANRVTEYRNAVNEYNTAFSRYKMYSKSMLYSIVYPEVPGDMRVLIINPVTK